MSVLQVGKIESSLADALKAKYHALQLPNDSTRSAFLAEHGPSVTAIVDSGPPGVHADLMNTLPNLGAIVHVGAGYDTIDVDEARTLGIGVSNTPDVLNDTVADAAVGLILATMRGICAADRYVRAGLWPQGARFPLGRDLSGSRIGILGLGRIGSAIATRLAGFGCAIAYHNRHQVADAPYRYAASPIELAESVDVFVVATAGGAGSANLVSREVLEALGPDGYLINVARGSVVDQNALVELLGGGRLAGAGLDVFAEEPNVPTELCGLDNVVLLPHVGGATVRGVRAMTELVLRNVDQFLTHGTLTTPVVQANGHRQTQSLTTDVEPSQPLNGPMMPWGKRADFIVRERVPFNAEPPGEVLAGGAITALDTFYCRNHGAFPDIPPQQWRVMVGGMVDMPLTLTYEQLTNRFSAHSVVATLVCAGNRRAELLKVRPIPGKDPWAHGAISTAVWRGARLADILDAAGVRHEDGLHVAFNAPDVAPEASPVQAYGSSIPFSKAMSEEVLLAWQMNSEPLPRIHGGPVRVVVPGYIGARSVKWVNHITVQPGPSDNYFQALDYRILPQETDPDTATPGEGISLSSVPLNCDILAPGDGAEIPAGPLTIHGWALAGDGRDIARVDVSLDGGHTWRQADLQPAISRWAWRQWSLTVEVQSGPMTLNARAWDDTGATQPESPAALWNPRGYANNAWAHVEVTVLPRRAITDGPRIGCPGSADAFAAPHPGSG